MTKEIYVKELFTLFMVWIIFLVDEHIGILFLLVAIFARQGRR